MFTKRPDDTAAVWLLTAGVCFVKAVYVAAGVPYGAGSQSG